MPRSLEHVFDRVGARAGAVRVRLTCLEVYRETVTDMFAPETASARPALSIREHPRDAGRAPNVAVPSGCVVDSAERARSRTIRRPRRRYGFFVEGLRAVDCGRAREAAAAAGKALASRRVGSHKLNARSSRSHCVLTIYVDSASTTGGATTYGSVSFVDLAGSERLKETGSGSSASMLRDAGHINKSLYTLGKVIRGLERMAQSKASRVPYRRPRRNLLSREILFRPSPR